MKKEFKKVSFPVAIVIFLIVAAFMAVGLAILKLNTMVTFLLAFIAMGVIAAILGMSLEDIQENVLTGFKKCALVAMIMISVGMIVGS